MSSEPESIDQSYLAHPRPMVLAWAEKQGTIDDALGHLTFSESRNGLWFDDVQQREKMEGTNNQISLDTSITF